MCRISEYRPCDGAEQDIVTHQAVNTTRVQRDTGNAAWQLCGSLGGEDCDALSSRRSIRIPVIRLRSYERTFAAIHGASRAGAV